MIVLIGRIPVSEHLADLRFALVLPLWIAAYPSGDANSSCSSQLNGFHEAVAQRSRFRGVFDDSTSHYSQRAPSGEFGAR